MRVAHPADNGVLQPFQRQDSLLAERQVLAELSQTTCLLGLLSRALAGRELNGARRLDCVAYPHDRLAARAKSPSKRGHACPRVQLAQHVRPLLV